MPNRMPEDMSDRMPEDLRVTKCVNVMVGITRSKVFFYGDENCLSFIFFQRRRVLLSEHDGTSALIEFRVICIQDW
jgi:hypothetical protein